MSYTNSKNRQNDFEKSNAGEDNIVVGRNAVFELLKSKNALDSVLVTNAKHEGSIKKIISYCKENGILIKYVDKSKLDSLSNGENHQGVAAVIPAHEYSSVEDILNFAKEKDESPFIIICDEIEDSHNLGAIIRTAEACGAHGVIIPKRRSAGLNPAVEKASCGAVEYMRVARVNNLANTIDLLKQQNIWVYGADMDGERWDKVDYSGGAALVVGNEGSGIRRLVKEKCDTIVSLPMQGKINSLNASVAAGIIMYEIAGQRLK